MPLALVVVAWLLIMTGIKGNYSDVGSAFERDVLGNGQGGGFLSFMIGIVGIAGFFRVIGLPGAGKVFLGLVLLVYLLQNENVLTNLQTALSTGSAAPAASTTPAASGSSTPSASSAAAGGGSAPTASAALATSGAGT